MTLSNSKKRKTIYVALSGGVDSSVAALLLKQKGYIVVGVYMRPWQPKGFTCLWEQERSDALRVAMQLEIPFETWDFSRQYARHVSRPMVQDYREGRTPNPDVECNRHIKFGYFYAEARARGADAIATGHYARIVTRKGKKTILKGVDSSKDQSYFLWGIEGRHLDRIMFPIGGLQKSFVRDLARKAGLLTATKKDSQGVCFVGPLDMKSYLLTAVKPKRGVILDVHGVELGSHDGAAYYTIGQRHGLDIQHGAGPYYVIAKDIKKNSIVVGPESALFRSTATIREQHWLTRRPNRKRLISAKIRYRTASIPVRLHGSRVFFEVPARAVAPGQSIVFYDGATLLGGALLA